MENTVHYLALALALMLVARMIVMVAGAIQRFSHSKRVIALETETFAHRLVLTKKEQQRRTASENKWNGNRKFSVTKVVEECSQVKSFYLKPHDGKSIPEFKPGQFLTFQIPNPGSDTRVNRCYSLSDGPGGDTYRVTIKRVPDGLVSNWFHDQVDEGTILDVKAPAGGFYLDTLKASPIVLVAGGVGITPLMSMLVEIKATQPNREVWLFYGVRNRSEHILAEKINTNSSGLPHFHRHICYSKPTEKCSKGDAYDHEGRVTLDLIKKHLPSNNYVFYICGPSRLMSDMVEGLRDWGVPEKDIQREAFGPASVTGASKPSVVVENTKVEFTRSGKTFDWKPEGQDASILQLACQSQIKTIDATGCHAGNCGTCQTAIQSGDFEYVREPGCQVETGSFLPCIAVPKGHLKIDA